MLIMASDARPHNRWLLLLTLRATAGGKAKGQGEIPQEGVDGLGLGHLNHAAWPLSVCPAAGGPASHFSSPRRELLSFEAEPAGEAQSLTPGG